MNENLTNSQTDIVSVTPTENPKKVFSKIGFALLGLFVGASALQFLFAAIINTINPDLMKNPIFSFLMIFAPLAFITYPLVLFVLKKQLPVNNNDVVKEKLSVKNFISIFCGCYCGTYSINLVTMLVLTLVYSIFGVQAAASNPIANIVTGDSSVLQLIANILFPVIIIPICEELLFRKAIIDRTIKYGEATSVLFSAICFGLFHANVYQIPYALFIGLIYGVVYTRTRNIKYSIVAHIINNFIGTVVATSAMTNPIATVVFGVVVVAMIIVGIVSIIKNFRKIRFIKKDTDIKISLKPVFLNAGTIISFVVLIIFTAFVFVSPIIQSAL